LIGLEHIVKEFQLEYKEVAKIIGVSSPTIQDWLKGRRKIPKKRLEQLSKYFGLPEVFFQKELTFPERDEIALHYLESISGEEELLVFNEKDEVVGFYKKPTLEDEIQYLRNNIENRKKINKVKVELEQLMDMEELNASTSPFLISKSKVETVDKIGKIMRDANLLNHFEVMVYLWSHDNELGGKPIKKIAPEYRDFAEDFLGLLEKYHLKNN
jgi:transcriptional regulator with XRE-family HTH domain